jgi:uncharacterized surface protein with fasciclin (FAS1) repeats
MQTKGLILACLVGAVLLVHTNVADAFGPMPPPPPPPPLPPGIYSLAPLGSCNANATCFEGSEKALQRAMTIEPDVCKQSILRLGSCALYAFPAFQGIKEFGTLKLYKESPGGHLWFHTITSRCGEVDAGPRMPADLFDPRNAYALDAYAQLTIASYGSPGELSLGRCVDTTRRSASSDLLSSRPPSPPYYTKYDGIKQYVQWADPGIMERVCESNCDCDYCAQDCKDVPDQQRKHRFCSLCGPKYNSLINITLYEHDFGPPPTPAPTPKPNECQPSKGCNVCKACCASYITDGTDCDKCVATQCTDDENIVEIAVGDPDLSTLVAALKAGTLVDTLSGRGPFTVFAPTNEAFAALPSGVLQKLLLPANKLQLVDILTYHVIAGDFRAKDLKDGDKFTTLEGKTLEVRVVGSEILINSARVTTANIGASNGVVHIIDGVLLPGGKLAADLNVTKPDLSALADALFA